MTASGELSLIGDAELRRDLSGYYQSQLQLRESEEDREDFFRDLKRKTMRIRPLYVPENVPEESVGIADLGASPGEVHDLAEVLREDAELRALISYAGVAAVSRVRAFSRHRDAVDGLSARVRAAAR